MPASPQRGTVAAMLCRTVPLVLALCAGCATAPLCPAPAPPPAQPVTALPLPRCDQDDTDAPLDAQRDRLVAELKELRSSLALLPSERAALATTRKATVARLASMLTGLRALERDPVMPVPEALPLLAALRRMELSIAQQESERRANGWGDNHPDVRALAAQRARASEAFRTQWQTELSQAEAMQLALQPEKEPRAADEDTLLRSALHARYSSPDFAPGRVASFDPISLRLVAVESAQLESDAATLSQTYGPRHPRMLALAERRSSLLTRFRTLVGILDGKGSGGLRSAAAALDTREERARELADQIALLSINIAEAQASDGRAADRPGTPCIAGAR